MKIEIDTRALQVMAEPGIGWIRIFGRGFTWKDARRHELTFSERSGHSRRLKLGSWSFRWLSRSRAAVAAWEAKSFSPGDIVKVSGSRDGEHDGVFRVSGAKRSVLSLDESPPPPPEISLPLDESSLGYWIHAQKRGSHRNES